MVKPYPGTNEKVRARVLELTGQDPGNKFNIIDLDPGTDYFKKTPDEIVEMLAQSFAKAGNKFQEDVLKESIILT